MILLCYMVLFFFFQAEDGIRDHCVTGVQTSALPICKREFQCHCFAAAAESKKTQIGSLAISREARPEGTFCSAQCNEPWPMRKKKTPMTILARICAQVGRRRSARHQRRRIDPAARWRIPAV